MSYKKLLEKIEKHVSRQFDLRHNPSLCYHNLGHTIEVVNAAAEIADQCLISKKQRFIVLAAAWFHDIGYLEEVAGHEERSAGLAEEYLLKHEAAKEEIEGVKACILSTKMPQAANTLLEKVICDADLYHLGTDRFFKNDKNLLNEYNALYSPGMKRADWLSVTLTLLEGHAYYTDYCEQKLHETQLENIELLKKKILEEQNSIEEPGAETAPRGKHHKTKFESTPDKGVETMFRVSSSNHQRLSDMADKKAHIMITVNSIILSAVISLVLRRLDAYGFLIVPSFMLMIVCLTAMIFSILSTRPSIPAGVFTKEEVENKTVNLLFFGNFYKMKLEDFNDGMQKVMNDGEFLYGSLIRDLYHQGVVLGKKYHLLRLSYNFFMFGLITSVFAFLITFIFFNHPAVPVTKIR